MTEAERVQLAAVAESVKNHGSALDKNVRLLAEKVPALVALLANREAMVRAALDYDRRWPCERPHGCQHLSVTTQMCVPCQRHSNFVAPIGYALRTNTLWEDPDACKPFMHSSRTCERGTRGCDIEHETKL